MDFLEKNKNEASEEFSSLPDFPDLPDLKSSLENSQSPIPKLPSLPASSIGDSFGIEAIKSSISGDARNTRGFNERRAIELPRLPERLNRQTTFKQIARQKSITPSAPTIKEPVFVKLDKFKMSYEKFQEIKTKASEIEEYLAKAKYIKDKEEQELRAWEEELKSIKIKISEIDSALFNRVQ